ncbi:MAG: hypothetical protein ABSE98_09460 [Acidimicrobiales bacterium]
MKGKWAAGISPRNFTWVIKDHLAVSERPGGFSVNHRRVRRQEEIIWLRVQGFGRVISLLPSPHNLAGPACGSWSTRTSSATGLWGWSPVTWSGRAASPTSPRPWRW